jgi:hypothetical protein
LLLLVLLPQTWPILLLVLVAELLLLLLLVAGLGLRPDP